MMQPGGKNESELLQGYLIIEGVEQGEVEDPDPQVDGCESRNENLPSKQPESPCFRINRRGGGSSQREHVL